MKIKNSVVAVENLDESAKFYTDVLGMDEIRRFSPGPGLTIAFFKGEGEATIELIEGEEGKKGLYMVGICRSRTGLNESAPNSWRSFADAGFPWQV